jgi:hypothetical protein
MDNVDRAVLAAMLLILGFAIGFWGRCVGNYVWEWQAKLVPVSADPLGLVALMVLASFAAGIILICIGRGR